MAANTPQPDAAAQRAARSPSLQELMARAAGLRSAAAVPSPSLTELKAMEQKAAVRPWRLHHPCGCALLLLA